MREHDRRRAARGRTTPRAAAFRRRSGSRCRAVRGPAQDRIRGVGGDLAGGGAGAARRRQRRAPRRRAGGKRDGAGPTLVPPKAYNDCRVGLRPMRVGLLTGGGDCPGLNAVIRAVVRKGIDGYGDDLFGFRDGWRGVLEDFVGRADDRLDARDPAARRHDPRELPDEPVQARGRCRAGPRDAGGAWTRRSDRDRGRGHARGRATACTATAST